MMMFFTQSTNTYGHTKYSDELTLPNLELVNALVEKLNSIRMKHFWATSGCPKPHKYLLIKLHYPFDGLDWTLGFSYQLNWGKVHFGSWQAYKHAIIFMLGLQSL